MVENVKFSNDDKFPIPIVAENSYLTNAWQMPDKYPRPPVGKRVYTLGDDSEN